MARALNYCGWGYEGDGLNAEEEHELLGSFSARFGGAQFDRRPLLPVEEVSLPRQRVTPSPALEGFCSSSDFDRITHTYGQSYPDFLRMYDAEYANAPDFVAWPETEDQIEAVLDWATGRNVAVIPYGGGSSVVGGVEPDVGSGFDGAVSLDLTRLNQVVEIDRQSRAARIQGGANGPQSEGARKQHGLTMRHVPQSIEMATHGGMIAT
ncbi:MAG: FAD-dependent oxidoreductase, partial [Pseudomonadota bacterium]